MLQQNTRKIYQTFTESYDKKLMLCSVVQLINTLDTAIYYVFLGCRGVDMIMSNLITNAHYVRSTVYKILTTPDDTLMYMFICCTGIEAHTIQMHTGLHW